MAANATLAISLIGLVVSFIAENSDIGAVFYRDATNSSQIGQAFVQSIASWNSCAIDIHSQANNGSIIETLNAFKFKSKLVFVNYEDLRAERNDFSIGDAIKKHKRVVFNIFESDAIDNLECSSMVESEESRRRAARNPSSWLLVEFFACLESNSSSTGAKGRIGNYYIYRGANKTTTTGILKELSFLSSSELANDQIKIPQLLLRSEECSSRCSSAWQVAADPWAKDANRPSVVDWRNMCPSCLDCIKRSSLPYPILPVVLSNEKVRFEQRKMSSRFATILDKTICMLRLFSDSTARECSLLYLDLGVIIPVVIATLLLLILWKQRKLATCLELIRELRLVSYSLALLLSYLISAIDLWLKDFTSLQSSIASRPFFEPTIRTLIILVYVIISFELFGLVEKITALPCDFFEVDAIVRAAGCILFVAVHVAATSIQSSNQSPDTSASNRSALVGEASRSADKNFLKLFSMLVVACAVFLSWPPAWLWLKLELKILARLHWLAERATRWLLPLKYWLRSREALQRLSRYCRRANARSEQMLRAELAGGRQSDATNAARDTRDELLAMVCGEFVRCLFARLPSYYTIHSMWLRLIDSTRRSYLESAEMDMAHMASVRLGLKMFVLSVVTSLITYLLNRSATKLINRLQSGQQRNKAARATLQVAGGRSNKYMHRT